MINVLIVDDHDVLRRSLSQMIDSYEGFNVIADAGSGRECLSHLDNDINPDIVLSDLNMNGMNGIELTEQITSDYHDIAVVILTTQADKFSVNQAEKAGAKAYLLKGIENDELISVLRSIAKGDSRYQFRK